jgi:two-component system KDP operon response regulator KdpE
VLIVEDQPELLRALRINLLARQYDVLTARNGREALALAAEQPPDAVILDLGLPDIDGTEVIVELRRWSRARIIVLSGRTSPGDKIGALDVGADDYVTKPFARGAGAGAAAHADRMAHPGGPAAAARPAGRVGADPGRGMGPGVRAAVQLPAFPHGAAAPQAGTRSGPAALADHRAGHGVPLPALTLAGPRYVAREPEVMPQNV